MVVFVGTFTDGAQLEIQETGLSIVCEGHKKFVKEVEHLTFNGGLGLFSSCFVFFKYNHFFEVYTPVF